MILFNHEVADKSSMNVAFSQPVATVNDTSYDMTKAHVLRNQNIINAIDAVEQNLNMYKISQKDLLRQPWHCKKLGVSLFS